MAGVNTVETQMADNDYATALLIHKVANSAYKSNTLIFIIEDDPQDGADHVDAHRSIDYVIGPYVKQRAVVSAHYTTVSMLRTIEDILGIEPMGLNDGLAEPMADAFDPNQLEWKYHAIAPKVLRTTALSLPPPRQSAASFTAINYPVCFAEPKRNAAYWARAMRGQDFTIEDNLDTVRFNQALWIGLNGDGESYPFNRNGKNLRDDRKALLRRHEIALRRGCASS